MHLAWPNMRDSRSIIVNVQEEAQTYCLLPGIAQAQNLLAALSAVALVVIICSKYNILVRVCRQRSSPTTTLADGYTL